VVAESKPVIVTFPGNVEVPSDLQISAVFLPAQPLAQSSGDELICKPL